MEARRLATYDDLLRVPDHLVAELIAGELITSPRPAPKHAAAASALVADLNGPFHRRPGGPGGPGGWWILVEPELHLGGDVLVPDLAGWRRETLAKLPDEAAFTVFPDWVCEVLSPRTGLLDRPRKLPIYARHEVEHAWLVDPIVRTLEVMRRQGAQWLVEVVHGGEVSVRAPPFEEVEFDLSRWWTTSSG